MSETLTMTSERLIVAFYEELKREPSGYKEGSNGLLNKLQMRHSLDFKDELTKEQLKNEFEQLYQDSVSVGILQEGIDGLFKERYKVTSFGEEQIDSFLTIFYALEEEVDS